MIILVALRCNGSRLYIEVGHQITEPNSMIDRASMIYKVRLILIGESKPTVLTIGHSLLKAILTMELI